MNSSRFTQDRRRWIAALLLVSLPIQALLAQDDPRAASPGIQHVEASLRQVISGDQALETVAFVERYWRVPGNAGYNSSINQVASLLEHAGFVLEDGARAADRLVYRLERRPMTSPAWEPENATLTIAGQPAPLLTFAKNRNMLAINSWSTPRGGVEAEVVAVGAGRPEDFQGKDVSGKIVYAEGGGMGRLFREAVVNRGAIGVIDYAMPAYTRPEVNTTSIQFGGIPLDTTRTSWGIFLSFAARESLRKALAAGPVRLKVETRTRIYPSEELTLIAEIRGTTVPDERFVFSAHVQEPGANDNASGVGTLAEIARSLGQLATQGEWTPLRTVTFIWGDEINATARFLQENAGSARGVRWGVSLDMVGENTQLTGGTFLIEKMPDPSAIWTRGEDHHTEWGGEALSLAQMTPHYLNDFVLDRCRDQAAVTHWVVKTNPFEGGSDHQAFLDAGKPGLLLWHFTDQFYHTDNDRLDKVSPETMANVGVCAASVAAVLASPDSGTARAIVDETERAALDRLATEFELSRAAVAHGGKLDQEVLLLTTWTEWYTKAIQAASDVDIGGPTAATTAAIDHAASAISAAGMNYIARLK
ncbi:MAG: M28 family peptidase [Gemmatimonadota bacterium]